MSASNPWLSLDELDRALSRADVAKRVGRVAGVVGTAVRAVLPDAKIGEACRISRPDMPDLIAEIVGFDSEAAVLMPLGELDGVAINSRVEPVGATLAAPCGAAVRGRVIDALGRPLDGGPSLEHAPTWPIIGTPPNPMSRRPIHRPLSTGVKAIDGILTIGQGQRMGIFAAAGVGKSTLLGSIARSAEADAMVIALIGERGREVTEFIRDSLGPEGLARSTVVVSTSEQPAMLRLKAAYTATAIAEHARSAEGKNVVLMMDSVTRFARALREIGLAANEPPGRQGYPASVFANLPKLLERAGNDDRGTMTALYTVLVSGDDVNEPVSDEARSLLDGHITLSRALQQVGHYPAIDIGHSVSRVMNQVVTPAHAHAASRLRQVVASYEENRSRIAVGMYTHQSHKQLNPVEWIDRVTTFLRQRIPDHPQPLDQTVSELIALMPPEHATQAV